MLWEHYLLLCEGDHIKALLIDRLIFYSQQQEELIDLLREEQAEGVLPQFKEKVDLNKLKGWVRKSANALAESLLIGETDRTVSRKLDDLTKANLIFSKTEKGKTPSYRPNLLYIESKLKELGFRLDGSRVQKEVVSPLPDDKLAGLWDLPAAPTKTLADLNPNEEWRTWTARNKYLDNAPEDIKRISWVIWKETGFEPDKAWIGQVTTIWNTAKQNEDLLKQALLEGEKGRREKGLVFKGPISYLNYVKNAVASKQSPNTVIRVGQNGNQHKDEVIRIGR